MEDLVPSAASGQSRRFAHWVAACATTAIGLMVTSIPASADQNVNESSGGGSRKGPPTLLVTPPLFLELLQGFSCVVANIGTVPQQVTMTFHTELTVAEHPIPDHVSTFTLQPGSVAGDGITPGHQVLPVANYCKFESTDTSILRASASISDGGHVLYSIGGQ